MASGYETLIITHPDISDEEMQGLVDKLKAVISQKGGETLKIEKWGKRKLVYKIKGLLKGCFLLCCFLGNQTVLHELDRLLRYNERVLRYQTTKLNKKINLESLRQQETQGTGGIPETGAEPGVEKIVQSENKATSEEKQEGVTA